MNVTKFSNLALSYSIQGKFEEAISYFDKAIRKSIHTIQKEAQSLMLHKRQRFIESEASNYMMPFAWVLEDTSLKNISLFSRLHHQVLLQEIEKRQSKLELSESSNLQLKNERNRA